MTWDEVYAIAMTFPDVETGTYHGYPALRVRGRFLVRLGDDHESLEFKALDPDERRMLLETAPDVFFIPQTYGSASVFARLTTIDEPTLRLMLDQRWHRIALKSAISAYDGE